MTSEFDGLEGTFPPLPDEIPDAGSGQDDSGTDSAPRSAITAAQPLATAILQPPRWRFRSLRGGCYLTRYTPRSSLSHYDGTIRVERNGFSTTASGDLYIHYPFFWPRRGTITGVSSVALWPVHREPSPGAGIPIFARSRYRYYLRITQILEGLTLGNSFTLGFQMHRFDHANNTWSLENTYTAVMSWTTAPSGYPSSADYLEGDVRSASGSVVGRLTMGWVSKYLRKATIEVDRVSSSEHPADNGGGVDWQDVFDQVGWDVNAYQSHTSLSEPSGTSWSNGELHQKMMARKDSANLDTEWRYHLLCVRGLDATSRGIMYDAGGTDSNNLPREGAAIASHWVIPNQSKWGTVQGLRFGEASAPYFRTAVHELGHAMGLRHNTADNGFMNTTGVIAGNAGTFPANIQWSFNGQDAKKLRHMPDAWVRPGEIPWAPSYSAPISPTDAMDAEGLVLSVTPVLDSLPLGAPVRVNVELSNDTDVPLPVPDSLSLKSEHVSGIVYGPSGSRRSFKSIIRCIDEDELGTLKPKEKKSHAMTLLRGAQGALFPAPGLHEIEVTVQWEVNGVPVKASGRTAVMVNPAVDDAHAKAALKLLSEPDTLLTLVLGGEHLEKGIAAITAGLGNPVLRPHYGVIEAKRIGRVLKKRAASIDTALALLDKDTVMSWAEARHVSELKDENAADEVEARTADVA